LGGNQSISAWRSAFTTASVTTGLQINVDGCAFRQTPRFFESQQFCVLEVFAAVQAHAHDDATFHYDSAD
jgi:hypothetical protein